MNFDIPSDISCAILGYGVPASAFGLSWEKWREQSMRVLGVVIATAVVMLSAGAAYAQNEKPVPRYGEEDKDKTAQEIAGQKAAERAYQSSLGNIPDKGPVDPWGSVRSDKAAKPTAKAAKVHAKPPAP